MIYLVSFVVLLSAASSVQALTTVTTADGNGADTFLANDGQSGDYGPDSNHGDESGLQVRTAWTIRFKATYLRFDISDVTGDLNDATIGVNLTYSRRTRTWGVFGLVDESQDNWDEYTITYNNAPGFGSNPPDALGTYTIDANLTRLADFPVDTPLGWYYSTPSSLMDDFINSDTDGLLTFAIIYETTSTDTNPDWAMTSKEGDVELAPVLTFPNALRPPASYPNPADGSKVYSTNVNLAWQAGSYADKHDVYLGTDETKVTDANRDNELGVLVSKDQDANSYPATGLTFGKTYYWRIDEVNGVNIWRGPIWSFTVESLTAYDPIPPDGFMYVVPKMTLRWTAGAGAVTGHRVYLGDNFNDVNNAPVDSNALPYRAFVAASDDPNWNPAGAGVALAFNTPYYWRIDEVNGVNRYKGDVWEFTTVYASPTEPNLIGLWKFDGDANDSSGYGCNGTAYGTPEPNYVDGMNGRAIYLLGTTGEAPNQYVDLPIGSVISTLTNSTFMAWVYRIPTTGQKWHRIFDFGTDPANSMFLAQWRSSSPPTHFEINSGGVTERVSWGPYDNTGTVLPSNEWHHLAVTFDANTNTLTLYVDGVVPDNGGELTGTTLTPSDLGYTSQNWVGRAQAWTGTTDPALFRGYVDDVRIYDRALLAAEIRDAMTPQKAWWPSPANGATAVERKPTLTWRPGLYAASVNGHKVYFDPNEQKVIDRSGCEVNGVTTTDPCYSIATLLEPEWTYYWAVDEVNDPNIWPGDVWSFTTRDYLVVEDFDSYADNPPLKAVWNDYWTNGSRAQVFVMMGTTDANLVQDGNSMKYYYENLYAPYYAEADAYTTGPNSLPSQIGSDWAAGGVKTLVLYFYGQSGNDANEQMYVRLHDADSSAVVTYGDYGEDPNDLRVEEWQEWNIDLEDFNSAGVDLTNVTRITIGFGDKAAPGGNGTVYFENIRLYPRRCVLSKRSADFAKADYIPTGYPSGDCMVNYQELETMLSNWLGAAEQIRLEAEDANILNPNAWEVRSDRTDASGGKYIVVAPGYGAPNEPNLSNLVTYDFTVSGGTYKILGRVVAPSSTEDSFWCRIPDANINVTVPNGWVWWDVSEAAGNNWAWDEINSDANDDITVQFTMSAGTHTLEVGYRERTLLDRLWITDELDLDEATLLAWDADLNSDDRIDLEDFALLANQWLIEQLWP